MELKIKSSPGRFFKRCFILPILVGLSIQSWASPGIPVAFGMAPTAAVGVQAGAYDGKASIVPELSLGFGVAAAGGGGFFFGALLGSLGYDPLQDNVVFSLGPAACSNELCFALNYLGVDGHDGFAARVGFTLEEPILTQVYLQLGYAKEFNVYGGVQHFLFLE